MAAKETNNLFHLNPLMIMSIKGNNKSDTSYNYYVWKSATWYGRKAGYYQFLDNTPYTAEQVMKENTYLIVDDTEHKVYLKPHITVRYADESSITVYYDNDELMTEAYHNLLEIVQRVSPLMKVTMKHNARDILS